MYTTDDENHNNGAEERCTNPERITRWSVEEEDEPYKTLEEIVRRDSTERHEEDVQSEGNHNIRCKKHSIIQQKHIADGYMSEIEDDAIEVDGNETDTREEGNTNQLLLNIII